MSGRVGDGGCEEVVGVAGLTEVGLPRHHSVPLVVATSTTTSSDSLPTDVIIPNVITDHLSDVINASSGVTIYPPNRVTLGDKASIIVKHEDISPQPPSTPTKIITLSTNTSACASTTSTGTTTVATYRLEPDWREAACDDVLPVKCKKVTAELVKERFGSGSRGKCIQSGKQWFTPTEFEAHCGRSASKDWKRSIRFQGQTLFTLIKEGYLQVHATSCSCGACLDDDVASGPVRLHRPLKRKKRDRFFLNTSKAAKHELDTHAATPTSATPTSTVSLPVPGLGELTVVPGLVLGEQQPLSSNNPPATPTTATAALTAPPTPSPALVDTATLPLNKAWDHMNEVLLGLERSVGEARVLLNALRERTTTTITTTTHQEESLTPHHKFLHKDDTADNLEAHFSSMAKPSEGFLVQVHEDDASSPSLQPILLDSLISSVPPSLSPTTSLINGARKKCVNCNRESELECSRCQSRAYCSDFCQRRDWVNHQGECGRATPTAEDPLSSVSHPHGYILMLSDLAKVSDTLPSNSSY